MKKITLFILCLLALSNVKAGDDTKSTEKKRRLTFTASIGADVALGGFASKDSIPVHDSTHMKGYSDVGYYFDFSAGYKITNVIGVMAMVNFNINDFNTVAYESAYDNQPNLLALGEVTASGSYMMMQYLAGPFFEFPASSNGYSKISIKLLAGSMHSNYPTLTSQGSATYTQSIASGSGFAYKICVSYEPYVYDNVRLEFNVGYGGGSITYPSVTYSQTASNYAPAESYTSNSPRVMSVGLIQLSTGVVVMF